MAKGRVGELESRAIEIIYFEEQREKRLAKKGTKKKKGIGDWQSGSSSKSFCLTSVRPNLSSNPTATKKIKKKKRN
jgi:hypothetical protein